MTDAPRFHSPSSESIGFGCLVAVALLAVGFVAGLAVGSAIAWALMWARS